MIPQIGYKNALQRVFQTMTFSPIFVSSIQTIIIQTNIMSQIKVNGKEQVINSPLSLSELLIINNVAEPNMVSIQVNGSFVVREDYDTTQLNENDEVDFLYFMGGGSK
jgi:sulfur carrier protein